MSAKTLYPAIPLKPIRFFRYRITHGPSKVKSGIDMHITSKEVIVTPIYYASHTCPFCWSYLQTGFGKFRISKCNGIPIPANKKKSKVHPRQKPKNSKCRWKGDRDHTACLYMGSYYFGRKLNNKRHFTVGTTPLRITQR